MKVYWILGVVTAISLGARAAVTTNYGDFAGSTVSYFDVTESTDFGMYGTPTVAGDTLDFNPIGLQASASNGQWGENNTKLQFYIQAEEGYHISELQFSEAGESRLRDPGSAGTASTYTDMTAVFVVDVLEVDGGTPSNANGNFTGTFASFSLSEDLGTKLWSRTMNLDIRGILTENDIDFELGATLVHITLDNIMYAASESGTTATIKKMNANGFTVTATEPEHIPEPSSLILLGTVSSLVLFVRYKFPPHF